MLSSPDVNTYEDSFDPTFPILIRLRRIKKLGYATSPFDSIIISKSFSNHNNPGFRGGFLPSALESGDCECSDEVARDNHENGDAYVHKNSGIRIVFLLFGYRVSRDGQQG